MLPDFVECVLNLFENRRRHVVLDDLIHTIKADVSGAHFKNNLVLLCAEIIDATQWLLMYVI